MQKQGGDTMVTKKEVMDRLRACYDPEIPVNIVDLGFIYGLKIDKGKIGIRMTFTSQYCPVRGMIADDIKAKLMALKGVKGVDIEFVFDPPWDQSMMSEEAKKKLKAGVC